MRPFRLTCVFAALSSCIAPAFAQGQSGCSALPSHAQLKAAAPTDQQHEPSDDDCALCAQLHLPTLSAGWVPLLVCLGLFVAFVTLLTPPLISQRVLVRLGCRGPPLL